MRKSFLIILTALFVLLSSGCNVNSTSKANTNSIVKAELTDRESAILTTTSEYPFVFDYEVKNTYKEVTVWLEKYQSGELVDKRVNQLTTLIEEDQESGSIIFAVSKKVDETLPLSFQIGVLSGGTIGSLSGEDQTTDNEPAVLSSISAANPERIDITEGEFVLASICFSNSENGMSTLPSDFYQEVDGNLNELKAYDVVYLLKGQFLDQDHATLNKR